MRKIIILSLVLFLTGCSNGDFKKAFDQMNINEIESYSVDLRVDGNYKNERVRDIYRISNYNDEQIIIRYSALSDSREHINFEYVFVNNELFELIEDNYEKSDDTFRYSNIGLSLEGLLNVRRTNDKYQETIGEIAYKVYEVIFKDNFSKKLVKEYGYDLPTKDITGRIYLVEGKLNRIIYEYEDMTFNFLYFGIGDVRKVEL